MQIRKACYKDLPAIKSILKIWVRDDGILSRDELAGMLDFISTNLENPQSAQYFVAEKGNQVVGMIGMHLVPVQKIQPFATTNNPAELINFYLHPDARGKGIGRQMLDFLCDVAKKADYSEMLVCSGSRFQETAYGFYEKTFGKSVGQIKNMYGEGIHAPVWRKAL